jgi:hypothetical protein
MNNIYETYSHTHRCFDFTEEITGHQEKIDTILNGQSWVDSIVITDKSLIEKIHDHTVIPQVDRYRLPGRYTARKNSQMLAPLLLLLNPNRNTKVPINLTQYYLGFYYSKIALKFLSEGYQTGFCICYDLPAIQEIMQEANVLDQSKSLFGNVPFLCVGHQEQGVVYNYQKDLKKIISSKEKISSSEYITLE